MLFNSADFIVFLGIVLVGYYSLAHAWQNRMLLLASYVFYAWWDWRFLSLLAASTLVDYFCSRGIYAATSPSRRRSFLLASVCTNLGILGFFKYFNFFVDSFASVLKAFGLHPSLPALGVILPVGISFYTFQTMGYTIDVYRGRQKPARDFVAFALYVGYFPQLVAGPIERSLSLLPQIASPRRVDGVALAAGCQLILVGYFRKVFIADGVAPYVDRAFADPSRVTSPELLLVVYLFALQIYGDFAGYTDIARGVSKLLGIDLVLNFKQPYLSSNITEFWRRWHISLSSWLRDYLYIPLGGNRAGALMTYRNLMLTMLLGGLWHGASWNFVVWGGLHGAFLAVHRLWVRDRRSARRTHRAVFASKPGGQLLKVAVTFHLVCLAWIFFRAPTFAIAWTYLGGLVQHWGPVKWSLVTPAIVYLVASLLLDLPCWWYKEELPVRTSWPGWVRGLAYAVMLSLISFVGARGARPFIYFQF